jgi:hypothetical protein
MIFEDSPGWLSLKRRNLIKSIGLGTLGPKPHNDAIRFIKSVEGTGKRGYAMENSRNDLFWIVAFTAEPRGVMKKRNHFRNLREESKEPIYAGAF